MHETLHDTSPARFSETEARWVIGMLVLLLVPLAFVFLPFLVMVEPQPVKPASTTMEVRTETAPAADLKKVEQEKTAQTK